MAQHFVKLLDLPDHDTDHEAVAARLKAHLQHLRERQVLVAYFRAVDRWEQGRCEPLDENALWRLRRRFVITGRDSFRLDRRAQRLVKRRLDANGAAHLKTEERERLGRILGILGKVPAVALESEHRADEIAASLHEEMPWMAPATEAAWHALRRSAREGAPVRIGPMILAGPPGVGKTAWAAASPGPWRHRPARSTPRRGWHPFRWSGPNAAGDRPSPGARSRT